MTDARINAALAAPQPSQGAPIDMVLHCPACGMQHIDAPEELPMPMPGSAFEGSAGWTNPPHRSHLCHGCGHIWRPADVPTNGVAAVKTKGEADSQPVSAEAGKGVMCAACAGVGKGRFGKQCRFCFGTGKAHKPAELPEPAAWLTEGGGVYLCKGRDSDKPLYLRPSESVAVSGEVSEDVIEALGHRKAWRYKFSSDPHHSSTYTFNRTCLIDFARAVLALAGSAKQSAALERMARLDDEMGDAP